MGSVERLLVVTVANQEEELELGYYGAVLRRRWWIVAAAALALAALVLLFLPAQRTTYVSEATILLTPVAIDGVEGNNNRDVVNEETEAGITGSTPVANQAIVSLNEEGLAQGWTAEDFQDALTVRPGDDNQLLEIEFEAETPTLAQAGVAAAAAEYRNFKLVSTTERRNRLVGNQTAQLETVQAQRDGAISEVNESPDGSPAKIIAQTNLAQYESQINEIQAEVTRLETIDMTSSSVIGDPTIPEAVTSGVNRFLGIALALVAGALAGAGIAVLIDRIDRRVRDLDEVETDLGGPVVGEIPRITEDNPSVITAVRAETDGANQFRRLATAMLARDRQVGSILITSANDQEGRTLTAINTAIALSQAGVPVLLINADRKNPSIDRIFGLTNHPGLEGYLRSSGTQSDATSLLQTSAEVLGIRVLPSGSSGGVAQPMSSRAIETVLDVAQSRGALVVVDAPPALSHPDGLALAALVDATYVVVSPGRTSRDELTDLRLQMSRIGSEVSGAIVNRFNRWDVRKAEETIPGLTVKSSVAAAPETRGKKQRSRLAEVATADAPATPIVTDAEWPEAPTEAPAIAEKMPDAPVLPAPQTIADSVEAPSHTDIPAAAAAASVPPLPPVQSIPPVPPVAPVAAASVPPLPPVQSVAPVPPVAPAAAAAASVPPIPPVPTVQTVSAAPAPATPDLGGWDFSGETIASEQSDQ